MRYGWRMVAMWVVAIAFAVACKTATWQWRVAAEAEFRAAETALELPAEARPPAPETQSIWAWAMEKLRSGSEAVCRPYRQTRRAMAHMPDYVRTLVTYQVALTVDTLLVWVMIMGFLLWTFATAVKMLAAGTAGKPGTPVLPATCETLPNGDIVVHLSPEDR